MLTIELVEGAATKPFEKILEKEMDLHISHYEKELIKIRTGRAHTSMIEDIKVVCYGSSMPLKELAALSAPDVQLLVVQPWDKSIMSDIEKAITTSELGITPQVDGNIIRIPLPKMSSSRRDDLVKNLHKRVEECKVSIRNVRKEILHSIRDNEKSKKISEDYAKRLSDILQKFTDKYCEVTDKLAQKKEDEIRIL